MTAAPETAEAESPEDHCGDTFAFDLCQIYLRHHAALKLRERAAVCAGADLDSVPADPRRTGEARPRSRRSGRRDLHARPGQPLPLAGLGRAVQGRPEHPQDGRGQALRLEAAGTLRKGDGKLFDFINKELLPHLHALDIDPRPSCPIPTASRKQRIIGRIMTAVERVRVDSETNLRDILDKVHEINIDHVDDTHFFTLSQVYEDLLLKMGEKNSDGGQFFTPREVIRAMVHTRPPEAGRDDLRPLLRHRRLSRHGLRAHRPQLGNAPASTDIDTLKHDTFFGREKENLVFPIALANLVLHGIDQPNLWHGNTLTKRATYGALFDKAPKTFDVILTNPPFGGKEGKDAQKNFAFETGATQVLFVQDILGELAPEAAAPSSSMTASSSARTRTR